ncbi:hypothetical protein L1987_20788 [Smallanthus sonchifolius]|uniref:Uncharacterized protein n=1 Tax=Smallanthus sonchifolius TaxID=185202 RepID=A0ACB9ISL6_9ASTR|nr:hypothetical protein L1987_20788 [Smallanthus sonchifolius]
MSSFTKHCSSRVSLEKRIARRFLCCPPSPICFLTLFFHMTVQTALDSKLDDEMNVDPNVLVICEEVALAHTIGLLSATVSMPKVSVSFTHIIINGEPAFSLLVSRFILGETFLMPVNLLLVPIIGGCGLASLTELNFNMNGSQ